MSLHFCAVLPHLTTSIWTNFLPLGQKVLPLNKLCLEAIKSVQNTRIKGQNICPKKRRGNLFCPQQKLVAREHPWVISHERHSNSRSAVSS